MIWKSRPRTPNEALLPSAGAREAACSLRPHAATVMNRRSRMPRREAVEMASVVKRARVRHIFGGEESSGWVPPHAPAPPRTPTRTVDLLVEIESTGQGFTLAWSGPEAVDCGDLWFIELQFAEHAAEELFGITGEHWEPAT